jgi:hypothetical protein
MEPNSLIFHWPDKPRQTVRTGVGELSKAAQGATRLPAGHPEGYLEAFANIYRNFAFTVKAYLQGKQPDQLHLDFPTVKDGVRGMAFIDAVVASSKSDQKWYSLQ